MLPSVLVLVRFKPIVAFLTHLAAFGPPFVFFFYELRYFLFKPLSLAVCENYWGVCFVPLAFGVVLVQVL